jgi:poly-gamma-glutamate capsule biosynthesis protein CapA/YwtB (metallophosphatase superfamily)
VTPAHAAQHRRRRQAVSGGSHPWRWILVIAICLVIAAAVALLIYREVGRPPARATAGTTGPKGAHHVVTKKASSRRSTVSSTTSVGNPVTISAVGDTDLGNTPELPPDPSTYLQPVEAALRAPIVFGNLEGTLTDATDSKCGTGSTDCFAFENPPAYAQILKAVGFTVINSANNHSHDFGAQGAADTTAALQGAGIVQAGLPGQIGVVTEGTTKVAFVDFAPYTDTNNLLDFPTAKLLIKQARSEAKIVVVYMHAGAEGSDADHVTGQEEYYVGEDRGNPEAFAHAAIDDGADLVIASGPHVLRGLQEYDGHLIDYSLGNFAGYQNFGTGGDLSLSGILTVTLNSTGTLTSGHFTSLALSSVGQPAVDASGAAAQFVNQLSSADFGSTAVTIGPSGQLSLPTPAS